MRRALIALLVASAAWAVASSAWTGSDDLRRPEEILGPAAAPVASVGAIALLLRAVAERRAGRA